MIRLVEILEVTQQVDSQTQQGKCIDSSILVNKKDPKSKKVANLCQNQALSNEKGSTGVATKVLDCLTCSKETQMDYYNWAMREKCYESYNL